MSEHPRIDSFLAGVAAEQLARWDSEADRQKKIRKVEALRNRASSEGEREAAEQALRRLRGETEKEGS